MSIKLRNKNSILIHALFWLYFVYSQHVKFDGQWSFSFELFTIIFFIVSVLVFYFNYFVILPNVFKSFSWLKLIVSQLIAFLLFGSIRYFFDQILSLWLFNKQNYYENVTFLYIIYDNFYFGLKTIFASSSIFIINYTLKTISVKDKLENEKKEAEINLLKSQINPHFLFNTLNNIYALITFKRSEAQKALNLLSLMMRYTTYETQNKEVVIVQEIEFMKSLIELTKFSYPNIEFIKTNIDDSILNKKIEPNLLSPFLENALKHGEISSENPIEMDLYQNNEKLIFKIKNKISTKNKDHAKGVGLNNIKKRLLYLYPNMHALDINIIENNFLVELKITLNEKI